GPDALSGPLLCVLDSSFSLSLFSFTDPATPEIYTLSLHDALPIYAASAPLLSVPAIGCPGTKRESAAFSSRRASSTTPCLVLKADRKSTRLNSSHDQISYAVFCLKKKKKTTQTTPVPHTVTTLPYR